MKTVTFPYAHTTYSLEVPDETAVLVSRVDELAGGKVFLVSVGCSRNRDYTTVVVIINRNIYIRSKFWR